VNVLHTVALPGKPVLEGVLQPLLGGLCWAWMPPHSLPAPPQDPSLATAPLHKAGNHQSDEACTGRFIQGLLRAHIQLDHSKLVSCVHPQDAVRLEGHMGRT